MAKQSLGRDLGALMGKNPKEAAPVTTPAPAPVGHGVRSLMRGQAPEKPIAPEAAPKPVKIVIPRWYLFAGDVLLVALALATLFASPRPLSWRRELFCGVTVLLAAVLAVLALLPAPDDKP